ncbi:hypothetical protein ACMBCM_07890 [Spiroplasma sp. K1]
MESIVASNEIKYIYIYIYIYYQPFFMPPNTCELIPYLKNPNPEYIIWRLLTI